ncbi:MAG: carboxypeptidase regulatory-like domain-containing protein [Verrucomicrobia bacterium]|nr:carboxypeptidase regulatory-like domain-containing protein [Verrucomicrobiota bacterium]
MFIRSIWIGFVGAMLCVASTLAASSELEGIVKDARGHPIQGADIRIETKDAGKLLTTVKTDASGHYTLQGLPRGDYRVTLLVNGTLMTSINNTTVVPGESTRLNFDLTHKRAAVTKRTGKHLVWVSGFPGSRVPGRWLELNDSGSWADEANILNVVRVSGEDLQRTTRNSFSHHLPGH